MKSYVLTAIILLALLAAAGCSGVGKFRQKEDVASGAAIVSYSADSLQNYKYAREYAAQGRYELAREHYVLALAATTDPYLQDALAQEIESVDMMIKTLR